jgi:hypothetical protein
MKSKLFFYVSCCLAASMLAGNSFAQKESYKELSPIVVSAGSSSSAISAKLNKAFNQQFKGATHLRWYEVEKKYLVKFIMNDRENRALLTKNGQIVYHISYGTETFLPQDVRHIVKSKYYDQNISRVLNVKQNERNIWVISLEDAKEFIMARVEDMELEETQRYQKSK